MSKVIYITDWLIKKGIICPMCASYEYDEWFSNDVNTLGWTCWECGYDTETYLELEMEE